MIGEKRRRRAGSSALEQNPEKGEPVLRKIMTKRRGHDVDATKRQRALGKAESLKMKIHSKDFRVREGDVVDLKKWPTIVKPAYKSKSHYQKLLAEHVAQLSSQQQLLYASNRHAVLLIFQAMDAAGKDGAIRHVMSGINPQGLPGVQFQTSKCGRTGA